jgi:hypothetical protein
MLLFIKREAGSLIPAFLCVNEEHDDDDGKEDYLQKGEVAKIKSSVFFACLWNYNERDKNKGGGEPDRFSLFVPHSNYPPATTGRTIRYRPVSQDAQRPRSMFRPSCRNRIEPVESQASGHYKNLIREHTRRLCRVSDVE